MNKLLAYLCAVLLLPQALVVKADSPVLKLNDNDWPPFFFGGSSGFSQGIGKEILDFCLPNTGYNYEFTYYPIKRMRKYMEEGKLDINIYSYRPARESFLVYGKEPIFTASYRPVVRKADNIKITSIDDFDRLQLGHLLGLRYSPEFYDYVMARQRNNTLSTTTRSAFVLDMLLENKIDVFVGITQSAYWYAKQVDATNLIEVLDFDIKTSEYFITLSKKSPRVTNKPEFLAKMDSCIRDIKRSGKYKRILQSYGM